MPSSKLPTSGSSWLRSALHFGALLGFYAVAALGFVMLLIFAAWRQEIASAFRYVGF